MRSRKREPDDSTREFEHSSQHLDLDALLAEHLGETRAAEAVVTNIETSKKAREERTARRGF